MIQVAVLVLVVLAIFCAAMAFLMIRFTLGRRRAELEWRRSVVHKTKNLGTTKSLEIIPLVDWSTSREDLKGEAGFSCLVKTDKNSILFDVGLNLESHNPSPLLHNMERLGIAIDDLDTIVISHNHFDHVGGRGCQRRRTFSLTSRQLDLGRKGVYTPYL